MSMSIKYEQEVIRIQVWGRWGAATRRHFKSAIRTSTCRTSTAVARLCSCTAELRLSLT